MTYDLKYSKKKTSGEVKECLDDGEGIHVFL
jgi:hypothetical protein